MLLSDSHGLPSAPTPLGHDRPSRRALVQPLRLPRLGGCPVPRGRALRPRTHSGTRQRAGHRHHCSLYHVGFSSGRLRQLTHDRFRHAAGTIPAAREPHRVVTLVVGDIEEGLCTRFVIAGKMSVRCEALRVENDLRRPVWIQRSGQRRHSLSDFRSHARRGRDYADPAPLFAHPIAQPALHPMGNPSRFRQCPNL